MTEPNEKFIRKRGLSLIWDCPRNGFTLMELLVAIAILSIISISCYIAFDTGLKSWRKSEARVERYQNARAMLDLISNDLRSAFIISASGIYRLVEHANGLYMTTNAIAKPADIYQVRYYWTPSTSSLYRVETALPSDPAGIFSDPPAEYILASRETGCSVTGFSVQFGYYSDSTRTSWVWTPDPDTQTDWNSAGTSPSNYNKSGQEKNPDGLPEAIRIGLAVRDEKSYEAAQSFYTIVYLPNAE